ncbi:MAG: threonine ammonia-lyase [Rhodovibrionaceae bacterium]|nr:threonine ammonia-lyase [Rhodovibrionaceae bacterium]
MSVSLDDIKTAAETISGEVIRTPLIHATRLSEMLDCELYLKLENHQHTGSFKDRGSLNKLKNLTPQQQERGVIAMSAGNHAQGVAYHATRLGIPSVIVMPEAAPFTKVERTRTLGARVVQAGETIDEAADTANQLMEEEGLTFVHPYDDPLIVAGQGTIGLEIFEDNPDIDAIVVPIGGGGICSGIATAAKALNADVEMFGVEAELYPSMFQTIHKLDPTSGGASIADGIAVKRPGKLTRQIIEALVSEIFLVDEGMLETAITNLVEYQKIVAEGAGAAGVAAIIKEFERFKGRKVATVICGGNIDVRLLASVLMRGLVRDGRLVRLRIDITDQPGVLAKVAGLIGRCGGNIVEVYHQRLFHDVPVKKAEVDAVIETRNRDHVMEIIDALKDGGFQTRVLSTLSSDGPTQP